MNFNIEFISLFNFFVCFCNLRKAKVEIFYFEKVPKTLLSFTIPFSENKKKYIQFLGFIKEK